MPRAVNTRYHKVSANLHKTRTRTLSHIEADSHDINRIRYLFSRFSSRSLPPHTANQRSPTRPISDQARQCAEQWHRIDGDESYAVDKKKGSGNGKRISSYLQVPQAKG